MTRTNPNKPLTVKLPDGLKATLAEWADQENLTLSAHVRRLLIKAVNDNQQNQEEEK